MAEEGFHDYTLATKLERLAAQLEQCFRGWLLTGLENISHMPPALGADKQPINLVRVSSNISHRMPWRAQPYILTLQVPYTREADLQAARQRQHQQQQQLQGQQSQSVQLAQAMSSQQLQQQQQQQQPAQPQPQPAVKQQGDGRATKSHVAGGTATPPAAPDRATAAAAASEALARHVVAAAAAGQGSDAMQKLQAQLAPLLNHNGSSGDGGGGNNNNNNNNQQQLQQQVDDLIQQYHQLHLQLQDDAEQQQQQQAQDRAAAELQDAESAAEMDEEGSGEGAAGSSSATAFAAAAATAARDALSGLGLTGLGRTSSSGAAAAAAAAGSTSASAAQQPAGPAADTTAAGTQPHEGPTSSKKGNKKLKAKKLRDSPGAAVSTNSRSSSIKAGSSAGPAAAQLQEPGGAGIAAAGAAGDDEVDEATSRQVALPAPEQLVAANSKVLAAVKAAVQQDRSRTAASRSWWPFCFDVNAIQQQLQSQAQMPPQQQLLLSSLLQLHGSGIPSIGLPWWSPGSGANKLQRWFGLDLFVLLQPASYSRRFLDAAESSTLLSVGRLALSSCGVCWPVLLPVHDALRDAYLGVAQVGGVSVMFHTDSIHISRLPRHLSTTEQQLSLFADQLVPHNPAAAAACLAVLGRRLDGTAAAAAAAVAARSPSPSASSGWLVGSGGTLAAPAPLQQHKQQQQTAAAIGQKQLADAPGQYGVWMSACFTFCLPDASRRFALQHMLSESGSQHSIRQQLLLQQQVPGSTQHHNQQQQPRQQEQPDTAAFAEEDEESDFMDWDADTAWHPWAQYMDPIQAVELDAVWLDRQLVPASNEAQADSSSLSTSAAAAAAAGAADQQGLKAGVRPPLSPGDMAALLTDVCGADVWVLHVLQHGFSSAPARPGRLGVKGFERHRRHVRVEAAGADWLWTAEAAHQVLTHGGRVCGVCPQPWGAPRVLSAAAGPQLDPGSFTTMLSALMTARTAAAAAHSLWELAGADWWESHGEATAPPLPPDSVFDSVLRDLLSPPRPASAAAAAAAAAGSSGVLLSRRSSRESSSVALSRSSSGLGAPPATPTGAQPPAAAANTGGGNSSNTSWQPVTEGPGVAAAAAAGLPSLAADVSLPRSAPPGSLLCRLALHALVFGNARAIAALWQRFVMQARLQFWEQRTLLPYLPAGQQTNNNSSSNPGSSNSNSTSSSVSRTDGSARNSFSLQGSSASNSAAGGPGVSAFAAAAGAPAGSNSNSSSGAVAFGGPPAPDFDSSLLHQKLQMLNICIWRRDRRLAKGLSSSKVQQQQQQRRLRSRHASSNSIQGGGGGGVGPDNDADSSIADEAAAAGEEGGRSSRLNGLVTRASSAFYSAAGDDDQDEDADTAAVDVDAAGDEAEEGLGDAPAAVTGYPGNDWEADDTAGSVAAAAAVPLPGEEQAAGVGLQELYEDAGSEFYSSSSCSGGAGAGGNGNGGAAGTSSQTAAAAAAAHLAAASDPDAEPQGVAAVVPGQTLLLYPERPLRVPVVQDDPVFTEDQIIHRQMALMQLAAAAAETNNNGDNTNNSNSGGGGSSSRSNSAADLLLLKQRLLAAPLLSDMCAFKAANPGCCFQDFLRWYSPKDWQQQVQQLQQQQEEEEEAAGDAAGLQQAQQQQQLTGQGPSMSRSSSQASSPLPAQQVASGRRRVKGGGVGAEDADEASSGAAEAPDMPAPTAAAGGGEGAAAAGDGSARTAAVPSNDWQQLWVLAEPQPAAAQRPLLNPQKEGELVLHYLETVSPMALFSQLLAAAVCEALSLLAASRGAALPAAADVVQKFHSMAAGVLRKGGGLSEAFGAADAAAGPPGREQQQMQQQLAGDWQGAEDGLSDVELELLLAEFSYVEQVVVLAESLLHHLPGQTALAARMLQHLLHGTSDSVQQDSGSTEQQPSSTAAAAECAVLGAGSRLPVACLTWEERHALLRWAAACAPTDTASKLQRELSRKGSAHQQHHQQQSLHQPWDASGEIPAQQGLASPAGAGNNNSGSRSSSRLGHTGDQSSAPSTPAGSHLQGLTSPKGAWPSGTSSSSTAVATAPPPATIDGSGGVVLLQSPPLPQRRQQASGQLPLTGYAEQLQELRRMQDALGQPAQQEWVTTCGPMPHLWRTASSDSPSVSSTPGGGRRHQQQQQQKAAGGRRLKPAVAAAVAAACGGSAAAVDAGGVGLSASSNPPVPPSRLYLQEADGEMRLAAVLVSQQGL